MDESNKNIPTNENLKLIARKECFLEGVIEVLTVNESMFQGKLKDSIIIIRGSNLHINKLDLDKEYVQLSGNINEIKYTPSKFRKFPKLFK